MKKLKVIAMLTFVALLSLTGCGDKKPVDNEETAEVNIDDGKTVVYLGETDAFKKLQEHNGKEVVVYGFLSPLDNEYERYLVSRPTSLSADAIHLVSKNPEEDIALYSHVQRVVGIVDVSTEPYTLMVESYEIVKEIPEGSQLYAFEDIISNQIVAEVESTLSAISTGNLEEAKDHAKVVADFCAAKDKSLPVYAELNTISKKLTDFANGTDITVQDMYDSFYMWLRGVDKNDIYSDKVK